MKLIKKHTGSVSFKFFQDKLTFSLWSRAPQRWSDRLLRSGKIKRTFPLIIGVIMFLIGGFLVFRHSFDPPPPIEEKFVLPKAEVASPSGVTEPSGPKNITPTPAEFIESPGQRVLLNGTRVSYQTFNNCGPANLSMILSYYGINKSQSELADTLRPYRNPNGDNDDKTVFATEFVAAVESFGLKALYRPNGSIQLIKLMLANRIPVVVKTLLKTTEDSAHFRVVRGFDEEKQVIIVDDSYFGPNKKISYYDFLTMWQPFNYLYIPVYQKDKQVVVEAIIGQEIDEEVAFWRAINRAQKEIEKDGENVWPKFNLSNSYYHVSQPEKCVEEFEKIESQLPRRALWYQIEPILAYQELGNYDRALSIIDRVLADDNQAFSELYQIRGEIYLQQDKEDAARIQFEQALKYNNNYQPAQEALIRLK